MEAIGNLGNAMGSTINAAKQLAAGTERLAEIFQRAGAQLQEVVPDSCFFPGETFGEEARSVAELLLAWREVGEVGVVFATRMLEISTCMSALVGRMELERKQRLAEASRLNQAWLGTVEKPRSLLERLTKSGGKSTEVVQQRKRDQEVIVTTCLETVMSQMESVRLEGRRTVADAVVRAQGDAKAVGAKIATLKTRWRGGLGHEAVAETTLLRLLQNASNVPWTVHDSCDEPRIPVQPSPSSASGGEVPVPASSTDGLGSTTEAPPTPAAPSQPPADQNSMQEPDVPPVREDTESIPDEHSYVAAEDISTEPGTLPGHNAAGAHTQNAADFWRMPMPALSDDEADEDMPNLAEVAVTSPPVAGNVDFWRMPMAALSDDDDGDEQPEADATEGVALASTSAAVLNEGENVEAAEPTKEEAPAESEEEPPAESEDGDLQCKQDKAELHEQGQDEIPSKDEQFEAGSRAEVEQLSPAESPTASPSIAAACDGSQSAPPLLSEEEAETPDDEWPVARVSVSSTGSGHGL